MPDEPVPSRPHRWVILAAGRICEVCRQVQAKDEFDDTPNCPGPAPTI